jgi:hypothetical protein
MKPKVKQNDVHFVVNANTRRLKCFDASGHLRWMAEAHCNGTNGSYNVFQGDTPPGLYKCGLPDDVLPTDSDKASFGPWFVPLIEMEGQMSRRGRSGIGVHGGGSGLADPFYALRQGWVPTHGCIRLQNEDVIRLVNTVKFIQRNGGTAWLSVHW